LRDVLWYKPESWVLNEVKANTKPVVLYFVDKDDEDSRKAINGEKVAEYSAEKAFFVIVEKPAKSDPPAAARNRDVTGEKRDSEKASEAEVKSPLPVDKLNAADRWEAYGIRASGTVIVADWFGNQMTRFDVTPRGEAPLVRAIDQVPDAFKQTERRLEGELRKVETQFERNNDGAAMKAVMRLFKLDVVGHTPYNTAVERYTVLVTRGRDRVKALEAEGDMAGLRRMRMDFRGSELETEIDSAVSRINAR
jgi:hypothetical protein